MPDLATLWFILIGVLLVGYAVLDGFDLGVGMLHFVVGRTAAERATLLRSIGPVWDGNEVWLLTMGGALFAAFPAVYATVFSGFYLALMLLLLALIVRAVSLEFRGHVEAERWRLAWDTAFAVASAVAALLLGVAIGNVAQGLPLSAAGEYEGGLLGLLNPFALAVGLLGLVMFVVQGANWLVIRTDEILRRRARRVAGIAWPILALGWLVVTFASRAAAPHLWDNFASPLAWIAPLAFVLSLGLGAFAFRRHAPSLAFAASSAGVGALVGILGIGLYPALLPDANAAADLTVANAASSDLTLTVMLVIALVGMPIVIAYTAWIYHHFWQPVSGSDAGY